MQISTDFRKILVDELQLVAQKVREEKDIRRKIFFFSGAYGVVFRLLNFTFNPELVLIHGVLNMTYSTAGALQTRIERGEESIIQIPDAFFDKLANLTEELATAIEEDKNICGILQEIATLSYTLTGNGYYLYLKGIIKA